MKIQDDLFLLCRGVSKDVSKPELNVTGVLDGIAVTELPSQTGSLAIVTRIIAKDTSTEESVTFDLRLISPSGKDATPERVEGDAENFTMAVRSNAKFQKLGFIIAIGDITVHEAGLHRFELIDNNNKVIDQTYLNVELREG